MARPLSFIMLSKRSHASPFLSPPAAATALRSGIAATRPVAAAGGGISSLTRGRFAPPTRDASCANDGSLDSKDSMVLPCSAHVLMSSSICLTLRVCACDALQTICERKKD